MLFLTSFLPTSGPAAAVLITIVTFSPLLYPLLNPSLSVCPGVELKWPLTQDTYCWATVLYFIHLAPTAAPRTHTRARIHTHSHTQNAFLHVYICNTCLWIWTLFSCSVQRHVLSAGGVCFHAVGTGVQQLFHSYSPDWLDELGPDLDLLTIALGLFTIFQSHPFLATRSWC